MKRIFLLTFCLVLSLSYTEGQGLHFSQTDNAPLLNSPANAGLLPDNDFRAGAIYRSQWGSLPVPFHTFSAFADFQLLQNSDHSNWLGLGGAVFRDKAGTGDLALTVVQVDVAYHLQLGDHNLLSGGLGLGYGQRSVDFSKLSFDAQWDGFKFDRSLPAEENYTFQKTSYGDISMGLSYSFFPNENVYFQIGGSILHINRPKESFYHSENRIGMRPIGNMDFILKLNEQLIADISGYYTQQKEAWEALYGVKFSYNVTPQGNYPNVLILGAYHRFDDAIIPVAGFAWNNVQFLASMDITTSEMTSAVKGSGALEFSIIYKGLYQKHRGKSISGYNCPRF